jgi:hypothetical protein
MAVINNLLLDLLRRRAVINVPDARRYYAANLEEAINPLLLSPVQLCNSYNYCADFLDKVVPLVYNRDVIGCLSFLFFLYIVVSNSQQTATRSIFFQI